MKKSMFLKLCATALAALSMSVAASANGFTKTNEYTEAKFTDVPANQWYAAEVKSAYELGFMNGQSDTLFAPEGNVTVAEGITMASRVHAIYNGKTIAEVTGGKWYDMYIAYAKENGLIAEGQFANYDRNIMRYEMAVMFANAMPADYFAAKNDIKDIPDVAETEEYYNDLMMLYKAGVVLGSDDYGNFYATNPIKRSETAAIINRVALPENRKDGKLLEYGDRNQAVFLIDDFTMLSVPRGKTQIASGWMYENFVDNAIKETDTSNNVLGDASKEGHVAIHRDVTTQTKGVVKLETKYTISGNGTSFIFKDSNGTVLFELRNDADGKVYAIGDEKVDTGIACKNGQFYTYYELDLDVRKVFIRVNGDVIGTFDMSKKAADLSQMTVTTHDEAVCSLTIQEVHMYVNYDVMDMFRMDVVGKAPYGWTVTDGVTVASVKGDLDPNSVKIPGKGSAVKTFDKVSGKFVYETFVKVNDKQSASVAIKNGDKTAVKVDIADGKITSDGKAVRDYTKGIWQLIRIEGDTAAGKALIKVNNKKCLEVALPVDGIDTVAIESYGEGDFLFDDVEVYNVYDYADYVPTPVPVTDDEWYVGMSVCSLWREGTHYGWDCISPYEEATPVLGYYDEGLPEVADWEIKFMVEHGIDFQHFCWYVSGYNESIKKTRLSDALNEGFMNAKYSDMQDFMIMWENTNTPQKSADDFKKVIWDYWYDWYLTDSRYFCIDNKPVITIYQPEKFIQMCGDDAKTTELFTFMREDIKRAGYDGLILLACGAGNNAKTNERFKKIGFDAQVCYNFGDQAYMAEYSKNRLNSAFDAGHLALTAIIGVGFNDIGWTETRTPNASEEDFLELLEWARDDYMPRLAKRESQDWISKFALHTTWNEYGEGHYIMPSGVNGFGYIDATRKVFSSVAGKDDSKHFDAMPTDNQKARLGYLYPANKIDIRRTYWTEDETQTIDFDKCEVVKGWYFDNPEDCKHWIASHNCSNPVYDATEKALVGTTLAADGGIKNIASDESVFNARDARYFRICMKLEEDVASTIQMYFQNTTDQEFQATKGVTVNTKLGDYQYYVIDMYSNNFWNGKVDEFRVDPLQIAGKFYIKSIEFLAPAKLDGYTLNIDGKDYISADGFFKKVGNEVFIATNPSLGFYTLNRFYYEWNRWNGTLKVKTDKGVTFDFTVGSDKVLVDGKEEKLAAAIEVVDGLPMLPVKFMYDKTGIKYTETDNGLNVQVRSEGLKDAIEQRVDNEWEFNVPGDTENWVISAATGSVADGNISFTATAMTGKSYTHDAQITNTKVLFDSELYKKCEVRFKPEFEKPDGDRTLTLYFATSRENGLSESKTARVNCNNLKPDEDGYVTAVFDFTNHEKWIDQVCTLRFDPTNLGGTYHVDYIRMIKDPAAEERIAAQKKAEEERNKTLLEAENGAPFHIDNPDAEGDGKMYAYSHNSVVEIVEDDLNPGNHAYKLTPPKDKKTWGYFMMPTLFKPGVKYRVEFDIRILTDTNGNPVEAQSLNWNMRYTDVDSNGVTKEMMDHHDTLGKFSTSDGWKHVSFEHKVNEASPLRNKDILSFFSNPIDKPDGTFVNISYMLDNFVVTVVE